MVALSTPNDRGDGGVGVFELPTSSSQGSILDLERDDVIIDLAHGDRTKAVLRVAADTPTDVGHSMPRRSLWRVSDLVLASTLLVATLPLMAALALLIRLSSRGPAVFRQERIGRSGIAFDCFKFRTMHADSEERLGELLAADANARAEWMSDQKLRNDPRITVVGRFLRKTNLDELPQLVNVLKGSMSMVGPRPVVPTETVRYGEHILRVLSVKPGITGLWQVSGRNDLAYVERVALDLQYVEMKSFPVDVWIIIRTLTTMITGRGNGAY